MKERDNEQWISQLTSKPQNRDSALKDLRDFMLTGLRASFGSRSTINTAELEDYIQESIERILKNLHTFRGDAKFTTWCMKIAVNLTLSDLRRKRWENISLDSLPMPDKFISKHSVINILDGPERRAVKKELVNTVRRIVSHDLTDNQQRAMGLILFHGVPLQEIAATMGMKRGALYKLLHEARKKIKERLISSGLSEEDIREIIRG